MYQPTLGRFLSQDPLGPDGVDVLYDNNWFGAALDRMRSLYGYGNSNPVNQVDPSGLACRATEPPPYAIPPEDPYHPVARWAPRPPLGYPLLIGITNRVTFRGVKGDYADPGGPFRCCTMDIEILARAYRYYRVVERNGEERFVDYSGSPTGVSNDPRDFFSLVVATVCRTNIVCDGQKQPDVVQRLVSSPLQKDGRGVFIRQGVGDIETTAGRFGSEDACSFAEDFLVFVARHTRPGSIDPTLPPM